ncbi:MAG: family 1 glycosylhydrolase [Steroidobacteraceae bacterium]
MAASLPESSRSFRFPNGFLWGAATASHQVEGGNRWNDWWAYEQDGRLPYKSGEACRHYELYDQDFELARSLGHNAHRFSIEWSRIEPERGVWDLSALEHYAAVIAALRRRGIEPVVTLHHFTNPAWFSQLGGWTHRDSPALFARYVACVAERLAADVRYWITINEPTVYVRHAYDTGDWPPCQPRAWFSGARALLNLCRAHVAAYGILHGRRSDVMAGIAHSAPHVVPCRARHAADRLAAWLRDFALNRLMFRLLGPRPREVLDFIGLNFYARQVVRWQATAPGALVFGGECRDDHHGEPRVFSALGWEIHAASLPPLLRRFAGYGVPLMITENGIATSDETLRTRYLTEHLRALALALREGVPVLGYLYWTLMDNFEWTEGYGARFGLAATDFTTQQRLPRPAAQAFKTVCETGQLA